MTKTLAKKIGASAILVAVSALNAGAQPKPIETTVCAILDSPDKFNNRLVKVRAYLSISSEYSYIASEECRDGVWFAYPDESGPVGLEAYVPGTALPGEKDSKGKLKRPIPVRLVRDHNLEVFEHYLHESKDRGRSWHWGAPCGADCHWYRVTATFTGRIDGVRKRKHEADGSVTVKGKRNYDGFGVMGMYDAQLVLQSVEDVTAIDLAHPFLKIEPPKECSASPDPAPSSSFPDH